MVLHLLWRQLTRVYRRAAPRRHLEADAHRRDDAHRHDDAHSRDDAHRRDDAYRRDDAHQREDTRSPSSRAPTDPSGRRWELLRAALRLPPEGGLVELSGAPGSGKSCLALALAAALTQRGALAAYLDLEGALCPRQAALLGVERSAFLPLQPRSGEEAFALIELLLARRSFRKRPNNTVLTKQAGLERA